MKSLESPQQDQKIELSPEQTNPYLARPEHFKVGGPIQNAAMPGNGQRGNNQREFARLLAIRASKAGKSHPKSKGVDLPTDVNDAGPPTRF